MTDEPVVIEATAGPYAGKRIHVVSAEAAKAIAEGWAKDPFSEPVEVKELTDEERWAIREAAEAGANRLRGVAEAATSPAKETRAMEADKPAGYEIRSTKK